MLINDRRSESSAFAIRPTYDCGARGWHLIFIRTHAWLHNMCLHRQDYPFAKWAFSISLSILGDTHEAKFRSQNEWVSGRANHNSNTKTMPSDNSCSAANIQKRLWQRPSIVVACKIDKRPVGELISQQEQIPIRFMLRLIWLCGFQASDQTEHARVDHFGVLSMLYPFASNNANKRHEQRNPQSVYFISIAPIAATICSVVEMP